MNVRQKIETLSRRADRLERILADWQGKRGGEHRPRAELFALRWALPILERVATGRSEAARMLAEFHEHPNALGEGTNTQALRRTLHQEEHFELMAELIEAAHGEANLPQIARELADVVYVTYGTAWAFGIDLDAALAEVHRAAMDKMDAGLRREDGKILKPPGFVAPDMGEAVRYARSEAAA